MTNENKLVLIASFHQLSPAQFLVSFLESNGIHTQIFNEMTLGLDPWRGIAVPADVMVKESHLMQAQLFLKEFESAEGV